MADNSLVGKLGSQIKSQISGFASGMKGAFVSANPALLAPAIGGIEKALKNQTSTLRREQEQRRAEKGFAEENANEQRKLFSDILGEQKESNDYLKKILEALLGKNKEESWWKNLLAPLLALGKYLKDGFGKLLKALNGLFDLLKAFKLGDLLKGLQLRLSGLLDDIIKFFKGIPGKLGSFLDDIIRFFKSIPGKLGSFLDDIIKFFKSIPGKLGSFVDDIIKFFKGIPEKLGGWLDEVARLLSAFPAKLSGWIGDLFKTLGALLPETSNALRKLFSDLADILKLENLKLLFDNAIKGLGNAFTDFIKLIKESNLFKAFGSLIDDLKAIPAEIATKIRGAIKAIQESDIVKYIGQLFDTMKLTFARVPGAVVSSIGALAEAIKGSDFIKSISQLGDVVEGKFTTLGQALDARFTAISDAIKASPITKAAGTIADDLAEIGRAFVADIRAKVPTPSAPDAPGAGATPEKPGFLMSAEDKIRARPQYVPPEVPGAGVLDETGTLAKIKNLIPEGMMKYIDDMGEAMAKVFLFVKNVGVSIGEGAKGLGRFLSAITDLDVMLKMIGKFVKALPVIGWIFTTIDGLQAAFDTSTIAKTLGKQIEDVTFSDRIKAFIGGFFGSFGGIIDFVAGLMGEETTVQKDMTAAITKLTDEIATQMMDLFKFFGGLLTSEPMMAIYKFMGSFAKIAFEHVGSSLKSVIELMVGILTFNPDKMMGGIKGLYDSFMRSFTETFALIGNLLKAPIARLINVVISSFEASINFFIDGMNALTDKLKSFTVFGVRIGAVFDSMGAFERVSFGKMDEGTPKSTTPSASTPPPPTPPAATSPAPSSSPVQTRPAQPPSVAPRGGAYIPGEDIPGVPYVAASADPLSIRNFNPGNIRYNSRFTGPGGVLEGAVPGEKGFARFATPEAGMEAMYRQLYLDTQTRGMTLGRFVSKYAPESENNTKGYISFIGSRTGLRPDDKIPPELLPEVMKAMVQMEGGKAASQFYYGGGARQGNQGRARSFFMGTGGGGPNEDYANWSDIQQPTGEPDKPVTVSPDDKWSEAIERADAEMGAAMTENLRIAQEEAIRKKEADEKFQALQKERIAQARQIADAEDERYKRERLELYRQFNQTAKNIYETTLKASLGNLGVTGSQAFVMGGSAIIDKYLGASFKSLGEKLFGKQQGGGMGMIFQKLLGSYTNQAVNQVIAPALGIPSDLMNRALNNFAQGNKKEAYADIVFGMTGVATDARTFLESITGKRGVDTAISQFSQTLADISTGPLADLFTMAPNGMGMYKVDPMMDPTVAGPAMGANMLLEGSKAAGRVQFEAAKASASILVTGAQTSAQIDEQSAKNSAIIMNQGGQGQQGFLGSVFEGFGNMFSDAFGLKRAPSGTMPGARPTYTAADYDDWYANPANAGRTPPWAAQANPFANLVDYTQKFAGFALGSKIGKGLGIDTGSLGGAFMQAGINNISGNFMQAMFTGGPGAAFAGLQNLGTMLMAGKFNPMMMMGGGLQSFGTKIGSQFLGDFGGAMSGTAFGGGSQFAQLGAMGAEGGGFGSLTAGSQLGFAAQAVGNAMLAYSLQSALSGGYKSNAGKAVAAIGSFFDPTGGFIAGTVGAVVNRLFGRKAPEVTGSGITGTLATGSGTNLQNYTDIVEKGGRYRSDKRYTQYSAADAEFVKTVQNALNETTKLVEDSAKAMSLDSSSFRNFTKDVRIELKGLSPEQQKKAIEDMITGYTEDMLTSVYPQISQYRKEIEGKLETNVEAFTRLANATVAADNAFRMLGYTAEEITDVLGMAITDTTSRLASANVKSQMVEAFGGGDKMQATLSNYLGKVYTKQQLDTIKLDLAKTSMGEIVKENASLATILDITKYGTVQEAKDAHLAAFNAAMKASDFKTANALASSYDTFIEGVRLNIQKKAKDEATAIGAIGGVSTGFVDESILRDMTTGYVEDQTIANFVEAATPIIEAASGNIVEGETDLNAFIDTRPSGTTGGFLGEAYGPFQPGQGGVTSNNTIVDNSTIVASRPTAVTVMRDDNVRDYHPILGSSNRGLSGGYGWGNDYQGSFGGG